MHSWNDFVLAMATGCSIVLSIGSTLADQPQSTAANGQEFRPLFNGRDLDGWETCLGALPGKSDPIGPNRDPLGVFRVVQVDGEPALRISGEMYGGLATVKDFGDYHLELEFKWGEKRFAPRAALPRDSGLLYHGAGEYNPRSGWLESVEFGILEGGETGDFWSVPGTRGIRILADSEGENIPPAQRRYDNQPCRFRPGGAKCVVGPSAVLNSDDNEKPRGQWNKLELICLGQTSIHVVNGSVNLMLTNIRRKVNDREEPITRGRLQLQSEGAEVFFRRLRLRHINAIPAEVLRALAEPRPNTLSAGERSQGWRLLFDGHSTKGWREYRQSGPPEGWHAREGALCRFGKGGDLITVEKFRDFELVMDWRISHGGNSGIFYRATEVGDAVYDSAPEFEIRDNAFWLDDPYTTGANYGLHPPKQDATRPVGYWNRAQIIVSGNHVEHWLNGVQLVQYELHSADWDRQVKKSKYRQRPAYGQAAEGHIGLQNHDAPVWYRNIKIRPLSEK